MLNYILSRIASALVVIFGVVFIVFLLISTTYVLVNTLTDIIYGLLDPRIRLESTS